MLEMEVLGMAISTDGGIFFGRRKLGSRIGLDTEHALSGGGGPSVLSHTSTLDVIDAINLQPGD